MRLPLSEPNRFAARQRHWPAGGILQESWRKETGAAFAEASACQGRFETLRRIHRPQSHEPFELFVSGLRPDPLAPGPGAEPQFKTQIALGEVPDCFARSLSKSTPVSYNSCMTPAGSEQDSRTDAFRFSADD